MCAVVVRMPSRIFCRRSVAVSFFLLGMLSANAASAWSFGLSDVEAQAKQLAAQSYDPPARIPDALSQIDQETYQRIDLRRRAEPWSDLRFAVKPLSAGYVYDRPVQLYLVTPTGVSPIDFNKNQFDWPSAAFAQIVPANLGFAGFTVRYPLSSQDAEDTILTFLGGAQWQMTGAGQVPGAHARAVAIDTGLPQGEQFPAFTKFWLVRPEPGDRQLTVYGLLDGQSLTGAYQFDVRPENRQVSIHVTATLFPRTGIDRVGLAPLSSMYFYGQAGQQPPVGQWRPAVFESDGLLMFTGEGDWVFRSLSNPTELQVAEFPADGIRGFGLMQRQNQFCRFEDVINRYDRRPSLWVSTEAGFGKGKLVLVQIPTNSDAHENQIVFFQPDDPVDAAHPVSFAYTLTAGNRQVADEPLATVQRPLIGITRAPGDDKNARAYRVNLDFAGGKLNGLANTEPVIANIDTQQTAKVLEQAVVPLPDNGHWRLSMLLLPTGRSGVTIRASLMLGKKALSETWDYRLPSDPNRLGQIK